MGLSRRSARQMTNSLAAISAPLIAAEVTRLSVPEGGEADRLVLHLRRQCGVAAGRRGVRIAMPTASGYSAV